MASYCFNQAKPLRMSSPIKAYLILNAALVLSVAQVYSARMVRLCIASVDPIKLSSQCVMCNRREFPVTAIDCTGISKMNDLISNPLSVHEATCLIYNCRRQVPDIRPEPYHGSVSHAVRANYPSASGTRSYEMMPPLSMLGGYPPSLPRYSGYSSGYSGGYSGQMQNDASSTSLASGGLMGDPSNIMPGRQQPLPYALVPASYTSPFGTRKYKAALIPLFR